MEPFSGWCSPFRGFCYPDSFATDFAFTFLVILCLPFPLFRYFGTFWDYTCVGWPQSCLAGILDRIWGSQPRCEPLNRSVHNASPPGLPVYFCIAVVCAFTVLCSFCLTIREYYCTVLHSRLFFVSDFVSGDSFSLSGFQLFSQRFCIAWRCFCRVLNPFESGTL